MKLWSVVQLICGTGYKGGPTVYVRKKIILEIKRMV